MQEKHRSPAVLKRRLGPMRRYSVLDRADVCLPILGQSLGHETLAEGISGLLRSRTRSGGSYAARGLDLLPISDMSRSKLTCLAVGCGGVGRLSCCGSRGRKASNAVLAGGAWGDELVQDWLSWPLLRAGRRNQQGLGASAKRSNTGGLAEPD